MQNTQCLSACRCGGMADAQDLKSWARKGVRVQVPPPAPPLVAQAFACFSPRKPVIKVTSMKALQAPDLMYLEAAKGWFILGDVAEARNELDHISSKYSRHPDVLEVEFAIAAKKRL